MNNPNCPIQSTNPYPISKWIWAAEKEVQQVKKKRNHSSGIHISQAAGRESQMKTHTPALNSVQERSEIKEDHAPGLSEMGHSLSLILLFLMPNYQLGDEK